MSATQRFRIAAIPADGVGPEVVAAGREVLDALAAGSGGAFAFDWQEFGWGCEYYARTGRMMAEDGLAVLKDFDAIYFGAVGWPGVPDHVSLWGLRLAICQNFDQWANVRPVRFLPGVRSPLRKADDTDLDWVVVRENSEGEYAGLGGRNLSARGPGSEVAVQSALFTEVGCERIMRFAFDLARTRLRRKVSSVTKSNAQQYGMVLWDDVFRRVARDYPDVETRALLVDAMSAKFVLRPEDLSTCSRLNLHATSCPTSAAPSPEPWDGRQRQPQPRGALPEYVRTRARLRAGHRRTRAGQPIGAVGSAALMLDHLGLPEQATRCTPRSRRPPRPASSPGPGRHRLHRRRHQGPDRLAGRLTAAFHPGQGPRFPPGQTLAESIYRVRNGLAGDLVQHATAMSMIALGAA